MAVAFRFSIALLVLLFAFGCNQDPRTDSRLEEPDVGWLGSEDSGEADASTRADSDDGSPDSDRLDTGGPNDAGGPNDDVSHLDAGSEPDSSEPDSGEPTAPGDHGDDRDAGEVADTGGSRDVGDDLDWRDRDAGGTPDAGGTSDAGDDDDWDDDWDWGGDRDAGGTFDTGSVADTGTIADTGSGSDAGRDTGSGTDAGSQPSPQPSPQPGTDPACLASDPYPSTLLNTSGLNSSRGQIQFVARDGNTLTAYTHRSPLFDPSTGKIVFIMHGANRNADTYLDAWRSEVNQHNVLAIAPEFPKSLYPGSEDYQLGVGTSGTPYTGTYRSYQWRDPDNYTHSEIEHLFEAVRTELGNASCRYLIYGHSAGGQFVHRLLSFRPDARVDKAVAANAGWYTLPSDGGGYDRNYYMPYGLQGAPPNSSRLQQLFAHELVVLLGEDDTVRGSQFRTTSEADYQGLNRLQRGQFYHSTGQQKALSLGVPFNWTLHTVPNVGHSNSGMTPAAATHLFGP